MTLFAAPPRLRRRPSLTPMIDVVFLLLVFFMLASRFGVDSVIPLPLAAGGGTYEGPPRLIDVRPDGLLLNGIALPENVLAARIVTLTDSPDDIIVVRGRDGATLQQVVTVGTVLRAAGFTRLVLVE